MLALTPKRRGSIGILALGAALLALAGSALTSSPAGANKALAITVQPVHPSPADSITVIVSGPLSCSNETVTSSHSVSLDTVRVDIRTEPVDICQTAVGSFEVRELVGRLSEGSYTVQTTLDDPCCFPCDPSPCVESLAFQVSSQPLLDSLPGAGSQPPRDADFWPLPPLWLALAALLLVGGPAAFRARRL